MSSHLKTMPSRLAGRIHFAHWHPVGNGSGGGTIIRTFSFRWTTPITLTVLPSLMYLSYHQFQFSIRRKHQKGIYDAWVFWPLMKCKPGVYNNFYHLKLCFPVIKEYDVWDGAVWSSHSHPLYHTRITKKKVSIWEVVQWCTKLEWNNDPWK